MQVLHTVSQIDSSVIKEGKILPLVSIPIQFRYLVSFLLMYVFPRAGSPTMITTHGATMTFAKSGHKSTRFQQHSPNITI